MAPDPRFNQNGASVVVLCAMLGEAAPIIERLGLTADPDVPWIESFPMGLWRHPIHPLALVTNGVDARTGADLIGTVPAGLATASVCEHLRPHTILVAGAAGGHSQQTRIGRVHLIDRAYHHDRRIPLPEFADYAHGPEPLHAPQPLADACHATIGTISTGNALDTLPQELEFFNHHGISIKDMETAAVAWTAARFGTRIAALRAITDFFDHATPEAQFLTNFNLAVNNLAECVQRAITVLLADSEH